MARTVTNPKNQLVAFMVDKSLDDRLAAHRERTGVPVSTFVRKAVEEKLERESVAK